MLISGQADFPMFCIVAENYKDHTQHWQLSKIPIGSMLLIHSSVYIAIVYWVNPVPDKAWISYT